MNDYEEYDFEIDSTEFSLNLPKCTATIDELFEEYDSLYSSTQNYQ